MPSSIAKAPFLPLLKTSRLTSMGMQYTVMTAEYVDVVTANGEHLTCTCGEPTCIHIQAVQHQQAHDAQANACRNAYCALFDLGYLE